MRVIFAGTPDVAVPALQALMDSPHEVVAVITQPDARGKRGKALHPSPIKALAQSHGLPVWDPVDAQDPTFVEQIGALKADVAAVVAYGQILRPALLAATTHGWVNLHFSILPAWRGAAPVQRSLMAGDEITGATTFVLDAGMDTGAVIGTMTERIRPTDTSGVLLDRLAHAGAPLLIQSIEALVSGAAAVQDQSVDGVSHAAKLTREDAYVAWERPAHIVDRQIRGCTPAPGAWTTLPDGTVAKLGPVTVVSEGPTGTPGHVYEYQGRVVVATGSEPVALGTIAPAGKKPMDAMDWWRGARLGDDAFLGEA